MTDRSTTVPAQQVELSREFNAPAALVFEAWTRADYWVRWFPPREFTMTIDHMDFRVGGTFKAAFHGMGMDSEFSGTYVEIVPGKRLVWHSGFPGTPDDLTTMTATFTERDGKTTVHIVHSFKELWPGLEQAMAGAPIGWGQTLDKLGEFLADHPAKAS